MMDFSSFFFFLNNNRCFPVDAQSSGRLSAISLLAYQIKGQRKRVRKEV